MIGKLDAEEDVMDDSIIANRKAAAVMKTRTYSPHKVD